jgi:hypothetical protein
MSYSEWLTRRTREAPKYLDTRPHGDASQFTETVKRQATVVRGRGTASDFVEYNAGAAYSEGTAANTKGPQIEIGPVSPSGEYGILTGFSDGVRKYILYRDLNPGSSDFTVECFFKADDVGSQIIWAFDILSNGIGLLIVSGNLNLVGVVNGFIGTIEYGVEYYCAISRSGNNWYGTLDSTTTYLTTRSVNLTNLDLTISGGSYYNQDLLYQFQGQISNFRYVKRALYTAAGTTTIPNRALQNISDTELLLLAKQDAPLADSSDAQLVAEGVFPTWTAGTSDYGILVFDGIIRKTLYYPSFPVTGDFTVELFFKTSDTSGFESLWRLETDDDYVGMRINEGNLMLRLYQSSDPIMIDGVEENTWHHVAVSRQDGDWYTSVNGVTTAQEADTEDLSNAYLVVGGDSSTISSSDPFYSGSISNFRVSNYARYTTPTYTIPTAPLSSQGARLLLLATQSNPFGDSAGRNVAVGSCTREAGIVTIPPQSSRYGVLAGFNSSNRLYYPSFPVTGDFTVELFFKTSDNASDNEALWRIEGGNDVGMYINGGELLLRLRPGTDLIMIEEVEENTWYHVAVSRQDGDWYTYTSINGITIPQSESSINLSEAYLVIGDDNFVSSNPFYSGSISNFRISNTALYTTTYTIPTAPLSSEGARLLLLATQSNPFGDSAGTNVAVGSCRRINGTVTIPPQFSDYGILTGFNNNNTILYYPTFTIPANFTVELFFKTSDTSSIENLWGIEDGNETGMYISNENLYMRMRGILGRDILMIPEVEVNKWYHVAVTRNNNNWYTSVDGGTVFQGSQVITFTGTYLVIGDSGEGEYNVFYSGSITNFRVSDTALYTENYDIPTLPLGDENATLLLLAKPEDLFGDSAGTNVSVETSGWRFGPITPLPSFSLYGILSDVEFDAGTVTLLSEFTVEFFGKLVPVVDKTNVINIVNQTGTKYLNIFQVGSNISIQGISSEFVGIPTLYNHYAICGRSGQAALYINGARATPFIEYDLDANSNFLIGSEDFTGSLTNLRFTNGQALYGDVYQIPALPLTGGHLLLLGKENAITTDSSDTVVVTGTATWTRGPISVETPLPFQLYGSISGFSTSTLQVTPVDVPLPPITGNFTIEAFLGMEPSETATQAFFSFGQFSIDFLGAVSVTVPSVGSVVLGDLPTGLSGYLTHFAISGNTTTGFGCYINGTRIGEYNDGITLAGAFYIGTSSNGALLGSITNFRISDTIRYSGQTVPIPSLPLSGGRFLLRFPPGDQMLTNTGDEQLIGTRTTGFGFLEATLLPPPPYQDYGILTEFTETNRMFYSNIGTISDFTVEFFFKSSVTSDDIQALCYFRKPDTNNRLTFRVIEGALKIYSSDGSNTRLTTLATVILGTWYHIALTRSGSTFYFSIDGTTNIVDVISPDFTNAELYIGTQEDNGGEFLGSISNFRITEYARYTTDFAVPAPPLSATDSILLLLAKPGDKFKDSSISDFQSSGPTPGWTEGPIPLYPYYGVLEFTETDYLTVNPSPTLNDFTIEWFARPTDIQSYSGIFDMIKGSDSLWCYFDLGKFEIKENTNIRLSYALPGALNNWMHYAICRSSGTTSVYVDGSQIEENIGTTSTFSASTLRIGFADENEFKGSLTNFRISNSALYSETTYTIPSLPLSGGELLLLAKPGQAFIDSAGGTVTGTALSRLGPIRL